MLSSMSLAFALCVWRATPLLMPSRPLHLRRAMWSVAEDPEEAKLDGDDLSGLTSDDDDEPLLIDDVERNELEDDDDEDVEEDDILDDDDYTESDKTDSLADLLRMNDPMAEKKSLLQEEWDRRELDRNETTNKETLRDEKRRQRSAAMAEFEKERGIGLLTEDPVCRAVVVCVTTGSANDNSRVDLLQTKLKDALGDTIELVHNPDPEPEEDLPLFEVWIEGYRTKVLHSRNWHQQGELTDQRITDIVNTVTYEVSDDAADVIATYPILSEEDD